MSHVIAVVVLLSWCKSLC